MTEGTRSNLFHEAVRIIKEMRDATGNRFPRWTVWENVPGALTSNNGHDFAAVLDSLADAGAMVQEWAILDAQNFGVAQRRRRIFLCSVFDPATAARCPDPLLPVGANMRGDTPKKRTKREGVTNSLTQSLGGAGPDLAHAEAGWIITEDVVGTLTPGDHGGGFNGQDAYTGQLIIHNMVERRTNNLMPRCVNARETTNDA
jgi:DNA (cytosine-5)-methyltransferase 1